MEIEILLSCMNQKDLSIVEKNNIKTKATIINQCDKDDYSEVVVNNNTIKVVSSTQRGLTNSRNLALIHASGDVCLLSDDDVVYKDDYKERIAEAFSKLSDADIIIFDINRLNYERKIKPLTEIRVAPKFKSYGSVRIAFKRESIQKNNIWFNRNFGSGSVFTSGEETLFLNESRRKKLKIYEYPAIIADVDFSESTWRSGYDEKFFYDKGALLAAAWIGNPFLDKFIPNIKLHS